MRSFRGLLTFGQYLTWATLIQVARRVSRQRLPGLATEIAYNATLALFPAIFALLAALRWFGSSRPALQALAGQFAGVIPIEAVDLIRNFVNQPGQGNPEIFSISFVITLWVSSNAMHSAIAALDQIQQTPIAKRRHFGKTRLAAILLTIGSLSLFVLASVLVFVSNFVIRILAAQVGELGTWLLGLWWCLNWPIALGIVATAFACLYKFGPSQIRPGQPVLPGAIFAACAWAIISLLFRHYVIQFGSYQRVYGAVGTVVILMLWLYLSALIMLIGQQLNVTVGDRMRRSSNPVPSLTSPIKAEMFKTSDGGAAAPRDPESS